MRYPTPDRLFRCAIAAFAAIVTTCAAGADDAMRLSQPGTHMFFGYYDVRTVDVRTGRHLAHRVAFRDRLPTADDEVELGVISADAPGRFQVFARTHAWNFQQGALLQWVGDSSGRVFFNDVRPGGGYRGVLCDPVTGERHYTDRALANLSRDGRWGLAINFDRLHDFRPGYGYAAEPDPFAAEPHPANDGVWLCDLTTGQSRLVLNLATLHAFLAPSSSRMEAKLLINHITFNPSGSRFVAIVRNFPVPDPSAGGKPAWSSAVVTAARDGKDLRLLVAPGYASHYHWRDDAVVIFHCDGPEGKQLYEITDSATPVFRALDPQFFLRDGHCSYSPDRHWLLYDSYPDKQRVQHLYLYDLVHHRGYELGRFAALPASVIDLRCDLHPRWLPDGRISFDSTHEGFRGVYRYDPRRFTAPSTP